MKQLIIGGARSGKSALAELLAQQTNKKVIYIATANSQRNDDEMSQRIKHHKQSRPDNWQTVEAPTELAATLQQYANPNHCLLVDCLTLWLTNCLLSDDDNQWPQQRQNMLDSFTQLHDDIILVGNEVGSGIVPMGEINRRFVDENGFLHQTLAKHCDRVVFTAAGLPLVLKGPELKPPSQEEQT